MEIKIEKLTETKIKEIGIKSWPIWEKEISRFSWHYDGMEMCYILEGEVTVTTKDGKSASFKAGDFVTFPDGLDCSWDIKKPVRKHYKFG